MRYRLKLSRKEAGIPFDPLFHALLPLLCLWIRRKGTKLENLNRKRHEGVEGAVLGIARSSSKVNDELLLVTVPMAVRSREEKDLALRLPLDRMVPWGLYGASDGGGKDAALPVDMNEQDHWLLVLIL